MNSPDESQRNYVLQSALSARTPEQMEHATQELNDWVAEHPDDLGIQWVYEQMALVELALQETARQEIAPIPLAALAKAS